MQCCCAQPELHGPGRDGFAGSHERDCALDRGERPGTTTPETAELAKAKKQSRQLETEVEILKIAAKLLGEDRLGPKGFTR